MSTGLTRGARQQPLRLQRATLQCSRRERRYLRISGAQESLLRTYAGERMLRDFPVFVLDHVRLIYPPHRGLWLIYILVILSRL